MRNKLTAAASIVLTACLMAAPAYAQAFDPTGGEFGDATADLQSFNTGIVAAAVIGLAVAVTGILYAVKWIKRLRGVG